MKARIPIITISRLAAQVNPQSLNLFLPAQKSRTQLIYCENPCSNR
jgi:hypothetical protein